MSKIGKINISIPEKVKIVLNGSLLNIEGPLGKKTMNIDTKMFDLIIDEGNISGDKDNEINEIFSFSAIFERTSVRRKIFEIKLLFTSTLQKSISDCTCNVLGIILFKIFTKLTKSEWFL